jgi:hypothetical protein
LAAATTSSTEALVNSTLCDDIAACQRNCADRHGEEETRAKTKKKDEKKNFEKDELHQKEHQNARCATGVG